MTNKYSEFLSHFPNVSNKLVEYARDTVFLHRRYLFVWRNGQAQMAYCTHCGSEYQIGNKKEYFNHNAKTTCHECSSECVVKSNGRGRSQLIDDDYVVWYEKSVVNPKAVVATWYSASRNYSGDYRSVETAFFPRARYYFEPGKGGQMLKSESGTWREMRHVAPIPTGNSYWYGMDVYYSSENIEKAVSGTSLQYSMWQEYEGRRTFLLDFFDLASKYPCVEYLSKLGLQKVINTKLNGDKTYRVVNWRGQSLEQVLKMPRADVRLLKLISNMEPISLHSYHYWRKLGWMVSPMEAHTLRHLSDKGGYYEKMLIEHEGYGTKITIAKYLLKQSRRHDAPPRYSSITSVLTEWRDYLRMCADLGMDLQQTHVHFPLNLHLVHDKTMRKVKLKRDEDTNRKILERISHLEQYSLENGQFLIRPAKSSLELFDEGKALNHCVGSYSDRYAEGKIDLFVLRKVSEPTTPLCTVEVVDGVIQQARGLGNSKPGEEEQAFLQLFAKDLRPTKKRSVKAKKPTQVPRRQIAG